MNIVDLPSGGGGGTGEPSYTYDTLADLRSETRVTVLVDDTYAVVFGRPTQGADGSGFFYFDATSTAPDDDAGVIQPSSIVGAAPGRWLKWLG